MDGLGGLPDIASVGHCSIKKTGVWSRAGESQVEEAGDMVSGNCDGATTCRQKEKHGGEQSKGGLSCQRCQVHTRIDEHKIHMAKRGQSRGLEGAGGEGCRSWCAGMEYLRSTN